jgi:hypothetical protein
MAFIRVQKLVRDTDGNITSGSAAIKESRYVKDGGKFHSRQIVRERLGKVVWLSHDGKSGIFLSPQRGLVSYDSVSDSFDEVGRDDKRLSGNVEVFPETEVHTVFGDAYLLMNFLVKTDMADILKETFPEESDRQRVLCHILHGILRDGSRIGCDCFMEKSFASYILGDIPFASLRCDTAYFTMMGRDHTRMSFFKAFVERMRKTHPGFGRCCYVDSTPLPNDIDNNPFNALCSHGVESTSIQTRLVLVLDEETGLPVWYDIIPGNVLDISTIMTVVNDVGVSLDITINSLVLDAGYISKEVIHAFHNGTEKTFIGRMPARKGFPFKTLYHEFRTSLDKGKYRFVRGGHVYFGKRKGIVLFDEKVYAYVYVDKHNALQRERNFILDHPDEYSAMKDKEKDWLSVRFGYFVLLSNKKLTPAELLTDYFGRTDIEGVIKTSKEYLGLLPLSQWTVDTVRGKILGDIMNTIIFLNMRKALDDSGLSVSEITGRTQSLMCFRNKHGEILVETPNKKVKAYYKLLGETIPASLKISDFRKKVLMS